mmetsp:Transcript_89259/g.252924  ORF Transcript_89259/g.252924 Transcript_89259/m.252924 type:complete len:258 (+) Transcript_89259:158-931(+)
MALALARRPGPSGSWAAAAAAGFLDKALFWLGDTHGAHSGRISTAPSTLQKKSVLRSDTSSTLLRTTPVVFFVEPTKASMMLKVLFRKGLSRTPSRLMRAAVLTITAPRGVFSGFPIMSAVSVMRSAMYSGHVMRPEPVLDSVRLPKSRTTPAASRMAVSMLLRRWWKLKFTTSSARKVMSARASAALGSCPAEAVRAKTMESTSALPPSRARPAKSSARPERSLETFGTDAMSDMVATFLSSSEVLWKPKPRLLKC